MHVQASCHPGSAEFPHDNPRLDACSMWVSLEPCVVEPCELAPASDHPAEAASAVAPPEPPRLDAPADAATPDVGPYATFVTTMRDVARAHGASDIDALASLLDGAAPASLSASLLEALLSGAILELHGDDVALAPGFAATAGAWRAVLRHEQADLGACGESTLDTFAADLLAHFVGAPHRRAEIRRDLRRRGVAAFGVTSA